MQIDNDIYITHNAKFDGTNWSHDDTTLNATALRLTSSGGETHLLRVGAASTWLTAAWLNTAQIAGVASATNYIQIAAAAAGAGPTVSALGTDTNVDILLVPKGTGVIRGATHLWGAGTSGQLAADNTTRYMSVSGITVPGTVENDQRVLVGRAMRVRSSRGRLDAVPGGAATRTFTLLKNAVATAITISFGAADSDKDGTGAPISFALGDLIGWQLDAAGTPTASRAWTALTVELT